MKELWLLCFSKTKCKKVHERNNLMKDSVNFFLLVSLGVGKKNCQTSQDERIILNQFLVSLKFLFLKFISFFWLRMENFEYIYIYFSISSLDDKFGRYRFFTLPFSYPVIYFNPWNHPQWNHPMPSSKVWFCGTVAAFTSLNKRNKD